MQILFDSRPFEVEALFFDKDGTLVDLHHQYVALIEKRLEKLLAGWPGDKQKIRRAVGMAVGYEEEKKALSPSGPLATATRAETMVVTAGALTDQGIGLDAALEMTQKAFLEADGELSLADLIKPAEGLIPVLSSLYQNSFIMACLTNDEYERTHKIIRLLKIADFFQLVICGNEVTRPKPDPEMFHQACHRLGVRPSRVAYIGDSTLDMDMARSAGAGVVVGIVGGASSRDVLQEKADVVIPHFKAITVRPENKTRS